MANRKSPLHDRHAGAGAKFRTIGDYEIADVYSSPEAEYAALTQGVGIVDLSLTSRFRLTGEDREKLLNKLMTSDLATVQRGQLGDGLLCNDRGGIIDAVSYLKSDNSLFLWGSAPAYTRLKSWLDESIPQSTGVVVADLTAAQGSIEIRGPHAREVLEESMVEGKLPEIDRTASIIQLGQARCLVVRRATGNLDTFRVDAGSAYMGSLWDTVLSVGARVGATAVGHRATEMFRIETGMPAIGFEIDPHTTPIEIGALSLVAFEKKNFPGRRSLLHSTCSEFSRRLVHLRLETRVEPPPESPLEIDGIRVGQMTSAAMVPTTRQVLALGFVDSIKSIPGTTLQVRMGREMASAVIIDSVVARSAD